MSSRGASGGVVDVEEAFTQLSAALDVLAAASWWQVASGELGGLVRRLHTVESRVGGQQRQQPHDTS